MESRRLELRVALFTAALMLLTACHRQESPSALEAAILAENWQGVEAETVAWTRDAEFQNQAAIILGYTALARGDSAAAVRHFLRARSGGRSRSDMRWAEAFATHYPDHAVAQLLAGDALAREGGLRAAMRRLDTALVLDPNLAVARLARGLLQVMMGERQAALTDLDALTVGGPVVAEALVTRSLVRLEAGQLEKALVDLNRALELVPEHAVAYNARGILHARRGNWNAATRDFEAAFRLAPELGEARRNWQITRAAGERGAVLSAKRDVGSITLVVADKDGMSTATAFASDAVRARTGQTPLVATNVGEAISLSRSHQVVLQVPNGGVGAVAGDRVLSTLNTIGGATGGKASVDIVTHGFGAADNTTLGALRHMNTAPPASQTRIGSLQMVDPSEASGLAGKTPLAVTDTGTLARRAGEIQGKGVPIVAFPTEGKLGVQHMGNVKAFQENGIPTYSAQWQGKGEMGLGLSARAPYVGPSVGMSNAADSAGSRANLAPRDWIFRGNGTEQHMTGTLPDLMKQHLSINPGAAGELATQRLQSPVSLGGSFNAPGGISVGPVHLARGAGGRVVFESGGHEGEELALVYTLFGGDELYEKAR